jgi:hypothetical protein
MRFQGIEVTKGDEVVLQRGKSRVTVIYGVPVLEAIWNREVGFQDTHGQTWYIDPSYSTAWKVIGYIEQDKPEVKALPTQEGFYVGRHEDGDEVFTLSGGTWFYGGHKQSEDDMRQYDLEPLYPTSNHFTAISTDKKTIYNLHVDENGTLKCECKGYTFRKECRHVNAYSAAILAG